MDFEIHAPSIRVTIFYGFLSFKGLIGLLMQKWEYIMVAIYEGRVAHINDIPLPEYLGIKFVGPRIPMSPGYYTEEFSDNAYEVINYLGGQGWEMVGVLPASDNLVPDTGNYGIYFKRPLR